MPFIIHDIAKDRSAARRTMLTTSFMLGVELLDWEKRRDLCHGHWSPLSDPCSSSRCYLFHVCRKNLISLLSVFDKHMRISRLCQTDAWGNYITFSISARQEPISVHSHFRFCVAEPQAGLWLLCKLIAGCIAHVNINETLCVLFVHVCFHIGTTTETD